MAGQSSEVFKSLEEEVQCPLCIDTFSQPKKLSCDHVVCCECLQELISRSTGGILTCPECRTTIKLLVTDARQFPTAHRVNRFIDIYKKTLEKNSQATTITGPKVQTNLPMCSLHTFQPLALYCKTCEKTVCRDCALTSCASKRHDYGFLQEMAQKHKRWIDKKTLPIKILQQNITEALTAIKLDDKELERLKQEEIKEIDAAFDVFMTKMREKKLKIYSEIEEKFELQTCYNSSKIEQLANVLDDLDSNVQLAESMISEENFLINACKISKQEKKLHTLHQQFKTVNLKMTQIPGLKSKVKFIPEDETKFFFHEENGYLCCLDDYNMLKSLQIKQPFKIDFQLPIGLKEVKMHSTFLCLRDGSSTSVAITKLPPNMIRLSFVPQKRGRHELIIQTKNNPTLCDISFSSFVFFTPKVIPSFGKPTSIPIIDATGVKCSGNNVYVTTEGTKAIVLERNIKMFRTSKEILLSGVYEMMVWGQYIYYTKVSTDSLVKASIDGQILASTGGHGCLPGDFNFPNGIRMSKSNEIYVCDSGNDRIQIFDTKLKLLRIIGQLGNGTGKLKCPDDLIFDKDGNIYVVEQENKRVQVLTPQGEHIRYIGISGHHCLLNPISASLYNEQIYITDNGRQCVSVFTLTGEFVTSFGEKDNLFPECIDIDQDGYIYITSARKTVLIY